MLPRILKRTSILFCPWFFRCCNNRFKKVLLLVAGTKSHLPSSCLRAQPSLSFQPHFMKNTPFLFCPGLGYISKTRALFSIWKELPTLKCGHNFITYDGNHENSLVIVQDITTRAFLLVFPYHLSLLFSFQLIFLF